MKHTARHREEGADPIVGSVKLAYVKGFLSSASGERRTFPARDEPGPAPRRGVGDPATIKASFAHQGCTSWLLGA
jgi:hypothetical protein